MKPNEAGLGLVLGVLALSVAVAFGVAITVGENGPVTDRARADVGRTHEITAPQGDAETGRRTSPDEKDRTAGAHNGSAAASTPVSDESSTATASSNGDGGATAATLVGAGEAAVDDSDPYAAPVERDFADDDDGEYEDDYEGEYEDSDEGEYEDD